MPYWSWQPTDSDPAALASIAAWCATMPQVRDPLHLDLLVGAPPGVLPEPVDAVFCANLLHIAPWACTAALMQLAARCLSAQGLLITYGPYLEDDVPTALSNLDFDADLRSRDPLWGLRRLKAVTQEATRCGLRLRERVAMPANNLLLVWVRAS